MTCECAIPNGGYCERHGIHKSARWVELCHTRPVYRTAWDDGHGPGQHKDVQPAQAPIIKSTRTGCGGCGKNLPTIAKMAWNLAGSLAAFVADGLTTVDADEYQRRLAICDACEERTGKNANRCAKCGCFIAAKAMGRAWTCPLGKWLPVEPPRT